MSKIGSGGGFSFNNFAALPGNGGPVGKGETLGFGVGNRKGGGRCGGGDNGPGDSPRGQRVGQRGQQRYSAERPQLPANPPGGRQAIDDAIMKYAYGKLDADGNGGLSAEEASPVKGLYDQMHALDRDQNGELSRDEIAGRNKRRCGNDRFDRDEARQPEKRGEYPQQTGQQPKTGRVVPEKREEAQQEALPKNLPREAGEERTGQKPGEAQARARAVSPAKSGPSALKDYAFDQLDTDGDGKLSSIEAAKSSDIYKQFFKMDENFDGIVSRAEFTGEENDVQEALSDYTFEQLDADEDGTLSAEEAAQSPELYEQFGDMDADQNGSLSRKEFAAKQGQNPSLQKAMAEFAFNKLDADGDGKLTAEELAKAPELYRFWSSLDRNGDGVISPEELAAAGLSSGGGGGAGGEAAAEGAGGGEGARGAGGGESAEGAEGAGEGENAEAPGEGEGQGEGAEGAGKGEGAEGKGQGERAEGADEEKGAGESKGNEGPGADQLGKGDLEQQMKEFAFNQLDTDKDGKLSSAEAAKSPEIYKQFFDMDKNQDGSVSKSEFMGKKEGGSDSSLPAQMADYAFKQLDIDGDKKISSVEAAKSPEIYKQFFEMDKDRNGSVNREEFTGAANSLDTLMGQVKPRRELQQ